MAYLTHEFVAPRLDTLETARHSDGTAVKRRHMIKSAGLKKTFRISRTDRAAGMKVPGDKRLLRGFGPVGLYRPIVQFEGSGPPMVW